MTFKLQGKFGSQVEDQGVKHLCFTNENSQDWISYLRGEDNIVQVFDTKNEQLIKQRNYKTSDAALEEPIVGLHSFVKDHKKLVHVMTTSDAKILVDDLYSSKCLVKPIKAKGQHVHKTAINGEQLAILSKEQTL